MKARAVIAEDEPLLAHSLRGELEALWPELAIVASAGDGNTAVSQVLAHRPDVVFLDIRMPGLNGLEVAQAIAEDWPEHAGLFPLLVFVTAYDQYALQAFEHAAIDYVLKPVQPVRLAATCRRLKASLVARVANAPASSVSDMVVQLRSLFSAEAKTVCVEPLRFLQVSVGNAIHMLPVGEVAYLEAADKYVRVVTATREHLIRMSLRDLLPRLDSGRFWQIHRGCVVRDEAIESALRDESGKVTLTVVGRPERLVVSRLYAHLFKAM